MYEVWDGDRIVYISISYDKAYSFWREKGRTGLIIRYF